MSDLGNKEIRFYNMNMGDRIKELRLRNEMTQEDFADINI